ncbi:protein-L-isoaspartate(D-aspartate) O-methyltransferase [Streptomyces cucumeris]|uniref:protein-L-isoaspartate(D-aspartate) O-methyltransferase n=1 Tax=Streptomyces cucumeris TaxID=2962890 RepID=UPI003D71D9E1
MDWRNHAIGLANEVTRPDSPWWTAVAGTPRHEFVPRWWVRDRAAGGRVVRDGAADIDAWFATAYSDSTIVTRIGPLHADHAEAGGVATTGISTSSSTLPTLVLGMYEHARIVDGCRALVTTGTGYGTALACHRLGSELVMSVDVDPYLVASATERLNKIGLRPQTAVHDLTQGPLPGGEYDRIVSTVSVRPIPVAWLKALRPEGRLVTTITGTSLILVADKTPDGGARGQIVYDPASFMAARHGDDYPSGPDDVFATAREGEDEDAFESPLPVLNVPESWEVWSMLSLEAPGIEHRMSREDDGSRVAWMLHADGSWARARTEPGRSTSIVHQGGPRRLYDLLDGIRWRWVEYGELPVYGARVTISPDGETTLSRGGWTVTL